MKGVKSYTSIWKVSRVLYAVNDFQLPFPLTYAQIAAFVGTLSVVVFCKKLPPIVWIDNVLLKYLVLPVLVTWFLCQRTLDGRNPFRYAMVLFSFLLRGHMRFGEKKVRLRKCTVHPEITVVRSVDVSHKVY